MKPQIFATLLIVFKAQISFAFLDFIADSAKDSAKAAAYADSVAELANELDDSSAIADAAKELADRERAISRDAKTTHGFAVETKSLTELPKDWSSKRLDENIRFTSRYVRRAKKVFVRLGLVGTDVATASNTAEISSAMTEMLKNQQTEILLMKEERLERKEREMNERAEWEKFIQTERSRRGVR